MSFCHDFFNEIHLHVCGRISSEDAGRQEATSREILRRLQTQPGLILADDVGMGKTFVALAVAASVCLSDPKHRPIVVMVPPSLKEKWPQDFALFAEKCVPPEIARRLKCSSAETAVDFLKLLDDPPERKKSLIFLTHGAMYRGLTDGWVKLAVIQRALYRRHDTDHLRRSLYRCVGELLGMKWVEVQDPQIWEKLLSKSPDTWLEVLQKSQIDPEGSKNSETYDDPVPEAVQHALEDFDTTEVFESLAHIPVRQSKYYKDKLVDARRQINEAIRALWGKCIRKLKIKLPLLIMDEAHHLKNAQTRLASLFQVPDAAQDAEEISKGPLGGVFERMLFLTATPFQLGHHELCSVLERFVGISWDGRDEWLIEKQSFLEKMKELREKLDVAQEASLVFDSTWGRLRSEDIGVITTPNANKDSWWQEVKNAPIPPSGIQSVLVAYERTLNNMRAAEQLLRPWVIRHLKPKFLSDRFAQGPRRQRIIGKAILDDQVEDLGSGIDVSGDALLPFLLAARATVCAPDSRPIFAEGLASSYEAFLHTRKAKNGELCPMDVDDQTDILTPMSEAGTWYLDQLTKALPLHDHRSFASHPKIEATINRALSAWRQGEKVVVFCHYVATGRALRRAISRAIHEEIKSIAAEKLGCSVEEAFDELDRLANRFFDADSPVRQASDAEVSELLSEFPELASEGEGLCELVRRNVRSASFLVRYFPIGEKRLERKAIQAAFARSDESGLSLRKLLMSFFEFLVIQCGKDERRRYIEALNRVQTGSIQGREVINTFSEDEIQGDDGFELMLPNVRLVNGAVKQETRQRLMLTFNTPFFPEILIASSVMAEGVDLHRYCRYVIHHDLCWNPSTLEQRTGRVDRIGAKVELCGKPIRVYLPYIAETQDEKMYRVVIDRERWFNVVMGDDFKIDARTTEKLANRVPLPASIAESLAFRLGVGG